MEPTPSHIGDIAELAPIHIVGIAVRTSNPEPRMGADIGNLWMRFFDEDVPSKLPGRISDDLYAVYTEYDSDATGAYTLVIGCPAANLDNVPDGMKGVTIAGGRYAKISVSGNVRAAVQQGWASVWQAQHLDRRYQADFEYYKCEGFDPDHAEVDIFVGVK